MRQRRNENRQRHTRSENKTEKKNKSITLFSKFQNKEAQKKKRKNRLSELVYCWHDQQDFYWGKYLK